MLDVPSTPRVHPGRSVTKGQDPLSRPGGHPLKSTPSPHPSTMQSEKAHDDDKPVAAG